MLALPAFGHAWGDEAEGQARPTPTPPPVPPTAQETAAAYARVDPFTAKPRLIALNGFGPNDNDNQQYLVRLLLYSNEIDIEAIIPTTSEFQPDSIRTDYVFPIIDAYGQVKPKRPVWVAIGGGPNTLAEALYHVKKTRSPQAPAAVISKLRVYTISDQDDSGPWMRQELPDLLYIVTPSNSFGTPLSQEDFVPATWGGINTPATSGLGFNERFGVGNTEVIEPWLDTNIRRKGPLGAAYPPIEYSMEGDTPSWFESSRVSLCASLPIPLAPLRLSPTKPRSKNP